MEQTGSDSPGATQDVRAAIEALFSALRAKDLDAALRAFADDAVLIDPHYPTPRMVGKASIAEGLRWAFGGVRSFGFSVIGYFPASDGRGAAVEVETDHLLRIGMRIRFRQVFVVEARDGLVTRVQAYPSYGPGGIGGLILLLTRIGRTLSRKNRR